MRKRATRKTAAAAFLASPPPPSSATEAPSTRSPTLSPADSPAVQFDFNLNGFADIATTLKKKSNKNGRAGASGSKRMQTTGFSPSLKSVNTISDLKDLVSSNLDSIKHQLERSHSEILKDVEASQCRLQKRLKIQTQACQQVMDEADKEYKKMSDRINEGREAMKASYAEFIAEAQAAASRQIISDNLRCIIKKLHKLDKDHCPAQHTQIALTNLSNDCPPLNLYLYDYGNIFLHPEELFLCVSVRVSVCKTSIPELAKTTEKGIALLQSRFGISSTAA